MNESLFPGMQPPSTESEGWYTAHCDGGSRGNPGPSGYGAVIEDPKGQTVARLSEFLGRQTNNFAEYKGLLCRSCLGPAVRCTTPAGGLGLRTDGEADEGSVQGRQPRPPPFVGRSQAPRRQLERFEMRHTLRGGNKEADRLANEAMDKGMGRQPALQAASSGGSSPDRPVPGKKPTQDNAPKQVLEGYVKGGVVHLLEGELPEGAFVKITRK